MASKSAIREQAVINFQKLTPEQKKQAIEGNIAKFNENQEKFSTVVAGISSTMEISDLRLSEVDKHTKDMNANIAELIISLDGTAQDIESDINSMQQNTTAERLMRFLSPKKASVMRESRVRNANPRDNLNNLLAKSNTIVSMLQQQLTVIVDQKNVISTGLTQMGHERVSEVEAKRVVTEQLNALEPEVSSLIERIGNETDEVARSNLQNEYNEKLAAYNELKMQEQEKVASVQVLESHIETHNIYLNSLQTQEGTQRVMINKIKADTQHRQNEWGALIESMKTATIQTNAHAINDVGVSVDKAGRQIVAGIAVATERRMGDMLESHKGNMAQAAFVKAQRDKAQASFDEVFANVVATQEAGVYEPQA